MNGSILVTGDSRGVGIGIVKAILNKTNYSVVGLSRKMSVDVEKLENQYKGRFHHYDVDLADPSNLKEMFVSKLKKHGPYFGLVNNAAIAYDDIITNAKMPDLINMFNVNVFSGMHLTKLILRDMLLHKTKGTIIHISSVSAHTGYKGLSMYAATKGAMEAFSKNTAREWGAYGIRSNCVCPGFMETEMSASLDQDMKDRIYKRTSLKQPTEIDSVAATVAFLLTDDSKSITGQVINVDSGTI